MERLPLSFISIIFFILFTSSPTSDGADDYSVCSRSYECGGIRGVGYPFWGDGRPQYCGLDGFELRCHHNEYPTLYMDTQSFRVLEIDEVNNTITVARMDLWDSLCPQEFVNTTLNTSLFGYLSDVRNLSLFYDCSTGIDIPARNYFTCAANAGTEFFLQLSKNARLPDAEQCGQNISVPVLQPALDAFGSNGTMTLQDVLNQGFAVDFDKEISPDCVQCRENGGICASNTTTNRPICYSSKTVVAPTTTIHGQAAPPIQAQAIPSIQSVPPTQGVPPIQAERLPPIQGKWKFSISGMTIAIVVGMIILVSCASLIFCLRKKISSCKSILFWRNLTMADNQVEAFLKINGPLAPKRYGYSSIKKLTNSFQYKLGQGGYGGVYKGKLPDGREVAVKLLNETKDDNGEGFMNEVASIGRTCHVNIVSLLGYCFEGSKRALIYEYMPNGSLEKFLNSKRSQQTSNHLEWNTLHKIAVGVARGLEYLHRGCTTRIFHFDIKPHNILLDEDFCPKISDFGLAKLCPKKESIVSMMYARGTIGYIAPEVFSRHFGSVTHKADVYSYGMLLLEMVGGRENIDESVSNTSETYFPHSIYKQLKCDGDLGLPGIESAEDEKVARKMILIGMCCIQANPSDRPAMNKVIEMLEASLESLQIPPEPLLSSQPRTLIASSTIQISEESESCEVEC